TPNLVGPGYRAPRERLAPSGVPRDRGLPRHDLPLAGGRSAAGAGPRGAAVRGDRVRPAPGAHAPERAGAGRPARAAPGAPPLDPPARAALRPLRGSARAAAGRDLAGMGPAPADPDRGPRPRAVGRGAGGAPDGVAPLGAP